MKIIGLHNDMFLFPVIWILHAFGGRLRHPSRVPPPISCQSCRNIYKLELTHRYDLVFITLFEKIAGTLVLPEVSIMIDMNPLPDQLL
jgi:hypothetical protein